MELFQNNKDLNPDVADALYELSNVGVGKATNALGKMTGERITIQTPVISPAKMDIKNLIGSYRGRISMGIVMRMGPKLGGAVLIIIDQKFMRELVCKLTGKKYTDQQLMKDEDSLSVIKEVSNIMASSFMTAISSYTGLRIFLTPVMVGVEQVGDLIAYPVEKMDLNPQNCICINTSFSVQGKGKGAQAAHKCQGNIVIFPDDKSIQTMVDALL